MFRVHVPRALALSLCLLSGAWTSVWADVVVMNNGDRLSGKVNSITGGRLLIETEYAGVVAVSMDAVAEVNTDEAFDVTVGGDKVSGQFAYQEGAQQLVVEEQQFAPVDLSAISRAGQNRLALGSFGREWNSRIDLSAAVSSGNSDTEAFNSYIESILKRDKAEHGLYILISQEEADGITTKEQTTFDYGYKRFLSEKWFASANAQYFEDQLKEIDERITLGGGIGHQFWDNSFGSFSTEIGVSAVIEELAGVESTNPALRWGLDFRRQLYANRVEVFHTQSILVIPDSDRGEVLNSSTGFRFALSDRIDTTARVDLNHETEPPPEAAQTDVTYSLGIGIKF